MTSFAQRFQGKTSTMTQQGLNGIVKQGDQPINKAVIKVSGELPPKPKKNISEINQFDDINFYESDKMAISSNSQPTKQDSYQLMNHNNKYAPQNNNENTTRNPLITNNSQNNTPAAVNMGQNAINSQLVSHVATGQSYYQQNDNINNNLNNNNNQISPNQDPYLVYNPYTLDLDANPPPQYSQNNNQPHSNNNNTNQLYSQQNIPRSNQITISGNGSPSKYANYTSAKNLVNYRGGAVEEINNFNYSIDTNEENYNSPQNGTGIQRKIPEPNKNNYIPSMGDKAAVRQIVSGGSLPHRESQEKEFLIENDYSQGNSKNNTGTLKYEGATGQYTIQTSERQYSNRQDQGLDGNNGYKPHTINEYKDLQKVPVVMAGGLGPNTGTDEWNQKQEQMEQMNDFAQQVQYINSQNLPPSNQRQIVRKQESREQSNRDKALEFAKNIPQPKIRPKEELQPEEEFQNFENNRETDIERLEKQHFQYLNKIEMLKNK